jgi:hypothetical protein
LSLALSLVIPAHNEAQRIRSGFERVRPVLEQLDATQLEVIVVDDGSSDETGRIAAEIYGQFSNYYVVRQETNRGKGAAVRLGVSAARGKKIVVCDADMAIRPEHLPAMLSALETDPIAAGSRAIDGAIHYGSWLRTTSGSFFNALVRRSVSTTLRDTQCGFKGFQLGAARLISTFALVDGFAYDVEMLFLASRMGLKVATVPVSWDDVAGSSVSVLSDSLGMLRDIRSLHKASYQCPAVTVAGDIDTALVREISRASRQSGLVIARAANDALIALPRDGSLAGVEIAQQLQGTFAVRTPEEFLGRELEPV